MVKKQNVVSNIASTLSFAPVAVIEPAIRPYVWLINGLIRLEIVIVPCAEGVGS